MKIIILILSIFSPFLIYSQERIISTKAEADSIEFNKMLNYFDSIHYSEFGNYYTDIPLSFYYKFFEETPNERIQGVDPYLLVNSEDCVTIIVEIGYPEGGYAASFEIGTFNRSGSLLEKMNLGLCAVDLSGGNECIIEQVNDTLIEVYKKDFTNIGEDYDIEKIHEEEYCYYIVNGNGFLEIFKNEHIDGKFSLASDRILRIDELSNYSREDLNLMRNEIFARHGYVFNNLKWKQYFYDQDWYEPNENYSNSMLTSIERVNIERILKVSKAK